MIWIKEEIYLLVELEWSAKGYWDNGKYFKKLVQLCWVLTITFNFHLWTALYFPPIKSLTFFVFCIWYDLWSANRRGDFNLSGKMQTLKNCLQIYSRWMEETWLWMTIHQCRKLSKRISSFMLVFSEVRNVRRAEISIVLFKMTIVGQLGNKTEKIYENFRDIEKFMSESLISVFYSKKNYLVSPNIILWLSRRREDVKEKYIFISLFS